VGVIAPVVILPGNIRIAEFPSIMVVLASTFAPLPIAVALFMLASG
jgi:hypothetical protein